MKIKYLLLVMVFFLSCSISAQEWEYVSSLQEGMINKVYAQGEKNVYVVGEGGLIAGSVDCGLTWSKQYFSPELEFNDITFFDDMTGIIVGNDGVVLKTEDAGKNWRHIHIGISANINAVAIARSVIWAVGNDGLIMYSNDVGETWIFDNSLSGKQNLYDIKFHESFGCISGQSSTVLVTTDGGLVWNKQLAYPDLKEYEKISSLNITESNIYALVFSGSEPVLLVSDGDNWTVVNTTSQLGGFGAGISFQSKNSGLFSVYDMITCGDCGFGIWIYKTIDGAVTWEEEYFEMFRNREAGRSNFSFSETSLFGYFLNGQVLLRTPYTGEFAGRGIKSGTTDLNNRIYIRQQGSDLCIGTHSEKLLSIDIISETGVNLLNYKNVGQAEDVLVNVGSLSAGIYFIRAVFEDKRSLVIKWIN